MRERATWVGAVGGLGLFVALVALEHALVPELAPRTHMLSEYANANGAAGLLMTVAFAASALSLALTAGIVLALPRRSTAGIVLGVLLLVAAAGMVGTAAAPTQTVAGVVPPGRALTATGHIHDLASGAVLFGFFPAALASLVRFPRPRWFAAVATTCLLTALAVTGAFAAFDVDADGLRQRLEVAAACAWQLALLLAVRPAGRAAPRAA